MEKLNFFIMVDDDPITNIFHEIILKEANICKEYHFYESPLKALDFFKKQINNDITLIPSVLFLDVNMPEISGWEFLDELLNIKIDTIPVIIMLTTSLSVSDKEKAKKYKVIHDFCNKPLTVEYLKTLATNIIDRN